MRGGHALGSARGGRGVRPWEDDDTVGRVYNSRLARRVWAYTRPYRGAVVLSALLFPLLAAVDLVQPYLVKVAIDDPHSPRRLAGAVAHRRAVLRDPGGPVRAPLRADLLR